MAAPSRRMGDDAAPAHAKTANPQPAHGRREDVPGGASSDRRRVPLGLGWSIPLLATVVSLTCIVAIAVPAALISGAGSEPDPDLSAAVREAPIEDEPAAPEEADELPLMGSYELGLDLAAREDARTLASAEIDRAVQAIQSQGFGVGYYVATLDGEEVLAYDADEQFYGASSIKGPYVLHSFAEGVPEGYRGLVESTIQWSDNDAYYALREERGFNNLQEQLEQVGANAEWPNVSFPYLSARQLVTLWLWNLGTLGLEGPDGDWLRQTFSATYNSAIGALPAQDGHAVATAYSKAGWIESGDLSCTVDAGMLTLDGAAEGTTGPTYVLAAMTNKGEDFEALGNVVNAIATYLETL